MTDGRAEGRNLISFAIKKKKRNKREGEGKVYYVPRQAGRKEFRNIKGRGPSYNKAEKRKVGRKF